MNKTSMMKIKDSFRHPRLQAHKLNETIISGYAVSMLINLVYLWLH